MKRETTDIEFSVLGNGLDFIYEAASQLVSLQSNNKNIDNSERKLKYVILHLSSGIELVFKYYLLNTHWTYAFHDMNNADEVAFNSGDFKSVDFETTIKRLIKLCKIKFLPKECENFTSLRKYRNKIAHFSCKLNARATKNALHKNISLIYKFICDHIKQTDYTKDEGKTLKLIKEVLASLDVYYVNRKNLASTEQTRTDIEDIYDCPECREHFLAIFEDGSSHCFFCEQELDAVRTAEIYIEGTLGITSRDVQKGAEYPLHDCPYCGNETFVITDEIERIGKCFSCHDELQVAFCCRCGKPFTQYIEGESNIICRKCLAEKMRED